MIKLKDEIQLVKWRHVTRENMDLPEGSTSTKMSSPLPSMQRPPTIKWVCHSTLLYIPTLKFVSAMRDMLWTKEMYHTSRIVCFKLWCEKLETCEKSTHPRGIFSSDVMFVVNRPVLIYLKFKFGPEAQGNNNKKIHYSSLFPDAHCFVFLSYSPKPLS